MTNTPNVPNNAPITISLAPDQAAALMSVTSRYASVLSWERRLDYAIAELGQWQRLISPLSAGEDMSTVYSQAETSFFQIRLLVEHSVREGLND